MQDFRPESDFFRPFLVVMEFKRFHKQIVIDPEASV